jgi:hypothetical protein
MGRVYTPEEVWDFHVSETPRHREAGRFALHALFPKDPADNRILILNDEPIFTSAMIYGSSVDGPGPNIRSDLDLLVTHSDNVSKNYAKSRLGDIVDETEAGYKLKVEPKLFPDSGITKNEVDPLWAEHIVDVKQRLPGWCVNDPSRILVPHLLKSDDWEGHALLGLRYLDGKAAEFSEAIWSYVGFANYTVLQRALELPSAIGRKILPATKMPGEILPPISDKAGTRALVEQRIIDNFDSIQGAQLLEDQRALAAKDTEYTRRLMGAMEIRRLLKQSHNKSLNGVNRPRNRMAEYDNWLEDNYVEACTRAERLSRGWALLLEQEIIVSAPHIIHELDTIDGRGYYGMDDYS